MTMTLVSTVTVASSGISSISFTSLPQTGTDLLVAFSARDNNTVQNPGGFKLEINGTGAYVIGGRALRGDGSSVYSGSASGTGKLTLDATANNGAYTASTFANASVYIPNYTSSTAKSLSLDGVTENNATSSWQYLWAQSAGINSAITSLRFVNASLDTLAIGSCISLYTITKGSGGATVS